MIENLAFGLQMTLVGMGLVFSVLLLLWAILTAVVRLDSSAAHPVREDRPVADPESLDPDLVAAIAVAVMQHTLERRRQAAPEMRTTAPGSQMYASRWLAAGRTRQTRTWQPDR